MTRRPSGFHRLEFCKIDKAEGFFSPPFETRRRDITRVCDLSGRHTFVHNV